MKDTKKKKTLLGLGTAVAPAAATQLVKGDYISGSILLAVAVACFLGYDYFDDKAKTQPKVPANVDAEAIKEAAELVEKHGPEAVEQAKKFVENIGSGKSK